MAKYAQFKQRPTAKKVMNPIWRGIGCILIVIVPLVAYWLMILTVPLIIATGKVPYQLLGLIRFPDWTHRVPVIATVVSYIGSINNLWLNIIAFFVIVLLLTGVASLLYSMLYALVGPARYTEVDAPPAKYKGKKYTR
jgi:uncharacterized membrane protein YuzA (DUF378 family)